MPAGDKGDVWREREAGMVKVGRVKEALRLCCLSILSSLPHAFPRPHTAFHKGLWLWRILSFWFLVEA